MNTQEFIDVFVEELEIEDTKVTLETKLETLEEWDSMGVMVFIGLVSDKFDVKITNQEIKELKSVNDLVEKIGADKFQ